MKIAVKMMIEFIFFIRTVLPSFSLIDRETFRQYKITDVSLTPRGLHRGGQLECPSRRLLPSHPFCNPLLMSIYHSSDPFCALTPLSTLTSTPTNKKATKVSGFMTIAETFVASKLEKAMRL